MSIETLAPLITLADAVRREVRPLDEHLELKRIIEEDIAGQPRSLQKRIGPSEVGDPCNRCLGMKLAGFEQLPVPPSSDWLPYVGSAMHAQMAEVFTMRNYVSRTRRWLIETQVNVGQIAGVDITGHSDLFDCEAGYVIDWKLVGATTLKSVAAGLKREDPAEGPSTVYRRQAHLYGRGFVALGYDVTRVAIYYLPRNALDLGAGLWWSELYDESVAVEALTRADALAKAIRLAGADKVIPSLTADPKCRDCPRYLNIDGSPFVPAKAAGKGKTGDAFA